MSDEESKDPPVISALQQLPVHAMFARHSNLDEKQKRLLSL
jgi:hypothetical protein